MPTCHRKKFLQYATEFESHADNVAATLLGGFVVTCVGRDGVIAVKRSWPPDIKVIIVSPEADLERNWRARRCRV